MSDRRIIYEEMDLSGNRDKNREKDIREKYKEKMKNKKNEKKHKVSILNLKLSIFSFIVMCIIALIIILNKGCFGSFSLVPKKDFIHTAELESDVCFLSITDEEECGVTLTVDGEEVNEGFVLESADANIIKVENNMLKAGNKEGTTTITAHYKEYDMHISTEITSYIPLNTIILKFNSTLANGSTTEIKTTIEPTNGTDDYITYTSSDESVATVSDAGVITGVSKGTSKITAKDAITGASATKTITVK